MANACFRCRASIESGRTFCSECRPVVSLTEDETPNSTRWWFAVAAPAVAMLCAAAIAAVTAVLGLLVVATLASLSIVLFWFLFVIGLYVDVHLLQKRSDDGWSDWYAVAALLASALLVTVPFVAAYHLHLRRERVGLAPLRSP